MSFFSRIYLFFQELVDKRSYESIKENRKIQRAMMTKSAQQAAEHSNTPPKVFSKSFEKKNYAQKKPEIEKKPPIVPSNSSNAGDKNIKKSKDFKDQVKRGQKDLVYLVRGKDSGKPAWHYVLVEKSKLQIFLRKTQGGSLDVADYGRVLYSGWGENPPDDIIAKINEEFDS